MNKALRLLGVVAIAVIAIAPLAYIGGSLSLNAYKWLSLALTGCWFVASLWPRPVNETGT